jgi:pSer/pThr/pTyr-binding forkhead associated (FHA) protein
MRLTDISVSRVHSQIVCQNGRFVITDNSSKFGTLVKINSKHQLSEERCAIQIGRTVIICAVKPLRALKFRKET